MKQNYAQKIEMQIPQENVYTGFESMNIDYELEKLSKDYKLHRKNDLQKYITKNQQLINYIHYITPLIKQHFQNNEKHLTYYTDPEYESFNCAIICVIGEKSLFKKEREEMKMLNREIINMTEFSTSLKNLIPIRLWWL